MLRVLNRQIIPATDYLTASWILSSLYERRRLCDEMEIEFDWKCVFWLLFFAFTMKLYGVLVLLVTLSVGKNSC